MQPPLSREALVNTLGAARHEKNLSIRRAATLAKVPPSTAQGWFEGRHLPTPALMPNFLRLVEALGLTESEAEAEKWHHSITRLRSNLVIEDSPYVGLRSYTTEETNLYVGRERAYAALIEACRKQADSSRTTAHTVVVVGDSGAGKSSLLAAGLIGQGCAPGGPLHHLTPMTCAVSDLPGLAVPSEPTLLVIDQFEEGEQLSSTGQTEVFDALAALPPNVTCVVAVSANAFGFAMRDDRFARDLASPILVGPLTAEEYTRIIEEPARLHGREVSPALVDLLLRDLRLYGDPSPGTSLPLLSSALRRCWLIAQGPTLTARDYLATGGLWSALNDEAETALRALGPGQLPLARRLILSMVQVDGDHILRRKIDVAGLGEELTPVVNGFLASRLFTRTEHHLMISHDALVSRWKRLGQWVEEERASLLIAHRIHMAAQLWDEGGRHVESLMPVEAELWGVWAESDDTPLLSPVEHEFIEASRAQAVTEHEEQQRQLLRIRRRQNVAVLAAVVAVAMMATALLASSRSNDYRHEAEAATRTAQARQVALIADEVRSMTPNTAGQLSVAALALDDSVETRSAVLKSAGAPMPTRVVGPTGDAMVGHLPEHGIIIRGDRDGLITVWHDEDLASEPVRVASGGGQIYALAVASVAGRALALVGGQQTAAVWDVTGEPRKLADFGTDTVTYEAAWQDGLVLIGSQGGQIQRIDFSDPDQPHELPPLFLGEDVLVSALGTSPDWILAGGRRDRIEVFTISGERRGELAVNGTGEAIALSPDGTEFLIGTAMGSATLWTAGPERPEQLGEFTLPSIVRAMQHLGERLLVAGAFGEIREYSRDLDLVAAYPERSVVVSLASVNGNVLVGGTGGTITLWDPASDTTVLSAPEDVGLYDITPGEDVLLVGTSAGARMLTDSPDGIWRELPVEPPPGEDVGYTYYYALSADGRVLVDQTTAGDLLTLERDGDEYRIVDSLPDQNTISDIRLSPTGRFLAVSYRGQENYQLFRREGSSWAHLVAVPSWPYYCAFSPDETLFAAMNASADGVTIWDLESETPVHIGDALSDGTAPTGISFSPSGNLAVGDQSGEISIYSLVDPAEPELTHQLHSARSSLSQISYSPDGSRLLAATREGQLWVWRVEDDHISLGLQLKPGGSAVMGAAWFNGKLVMSLYDGRTVAWPDDPVGAAKDLCSRFGDRLSEDEWLRLVPGVSPTDGCQE